MNLATVEHDLRYLFFSLPAEARATLIWAAVFLVYSCFLLGVEAFLSCVFRRSGKWQGAVRPAVRLRNHPAEVHPQELRLRRMVMNDAATARRLMALELNRGAHNWAMAAERAADRLQWERNR